MITESLRRYLDMVRAEEAQDTLDEVECLKQQDYSSEFS